MKSIVTSLFMLFSFSIWVEAAVRNNVVVIEASEGVQYSVQEMAKDYLLGYVYPQKYSLKTKIQQNIQMLDTNIKKIVINTKDKKTKGILSYFVTQKSQIRELLEQTRDIESAEMMVGVSEIFSEGSRSIINQHKYSFAREERMLMLTKEMMTLVGAIVKYYIAIEINPDDVSNRKKMGKVIHTFVSNLKKVNSYTYGTEILNEKESLNRLWRVMYTYINRIETLKVPALLSITSKNIQNILETLSIYHSKNQ